MRNFRHPLIALLLTAMVATGCSDSSEDPQTQPDPSSETTSEAPTEPTASPTPTGPPAKKIGLDVFPAIAQPGKKPAASDALMVTAKVKPVASGATVLLQRRGSGGWKTVSREQQDDTGTATFAEAGQQGGSGAMLYRAAVENPGEAKPVTSNPVDAAGWTTAFREEFDGTSLDTAKWRHRQLGLYNPDGSRQCSKSDQSAVAVSKGTLKLQVRKDPKRTGEKCVTPEYGTHGYYLNGHVSTEETFTFTHGVAAARVKFQRGRGQHGAFWMQRDSGAALVPGQPFVSGAEVDVVEFFGEGYADGGLAAFIYYLNDQNENEKVGGLWPRATRQLPPGDDWWSSYHVFSVEWTPQEYVVRVDGREIFRTGEGVSGVEQFLILSLLSSDWELGKLDDSMLPSTMQVDWVRVWQRP